MIDRLPLPPVAISSNHSKTPRFPSHQPTSVLLPEASAMSQTQPNHPPPKPDPTPAPTFHSSDYAPYPKLEPNDLTSTPSPSDSSAAAAATSMPTESNPYVAPSTVAAPQSSVKNTVDTVKDVLGMWGKKAVDATKKGQDLAGNMWQHLKTGPSFADAAVGRIAQGTKVLAEGGYEKIFRNTFETIEEEQLLKSYACYLSTSAGPVMGTLYLSSAKLAFCSDNPLSYKAGDQNEWSYYKVVIPLHQLKAVNPSTSRANGAEKYIQMISVDNHEFWFMGFVQYDSAVKNIQGSVPRHTL